MSACHACLCFDRGRRRGLMTCQCLRLFFFFSPPFSSDLTTVWKTSHLIPLDSQNKFPELLMPSYQLTWLHTLGNTKTHTHSLKPCTLWELPSTLYPSVTSKAMPNSIFNSKLIHKNAWGQWIPIPNSLCYLLWKLDSVISVKDDCVPVSHKNVKVCAHICPHPFAKL